MDITKLALKWYRGGPYPYWYGCFGQKPTAALLAQKKKQYPTEYAKIQTLGNYDVPSPYAAVFDCIGFIRALCLYHPAKNPLGAIAYKGYGKAGGSTFMDISANQAWRAWGGTNSISTIPEPTAQKPVAVFMKNSQGVVSHVGLYVGKIAGVKTVIESTPPQLKMAALKSRPWCGWGYVSEKWLVWADTYFEGTAAPAPEKPVQKPPVPQESGLKIGDRVRIKKYGIPYYPGEVKIPDQPWMRGWMTVSGLGNKGSPAVPCARLAEITSWCATENLEKAGD